MFLFSKMELVDFATFWSPSNLSTNYVLLHFYCVECLCINFVTCLSQLFQYSSISSTMSPTLSIFFIFLFYFILVFIAITS